MAAAVRTPTAPRGVHARSLFALCLLALLGVTAGCGEDYAASDFDLAAHVKAYTYDFPPDLPFDASEWDTSDGSPFLGDPRAVRVKDRAFKVPWVAFPTTLRTEGPNANSMQTRAIHNLMYEAMVGLHSETGDWSPGLARYWKTTDHADGTQTFTFRLDERARWSDGEPVEADDVYYSWWHRVQEDRKEPSSVMTYTEGFEEPKVLDRLTISVKTKKPNWRLFLYFGGMAIYPAPYVKMPGEVYLKLYNWQMFPGTGPYRFDAKGMKKGEYLTMYRRDDWWGDQDPSNAHQYNFDQIRYITIRDREMIYETYRERDPESLDWYVVGMARRWVEDIPKEEIIQKGWVQKRKIYNEHPVGYNGFAFNMRVPPFNDKRVRQAFAHLFNRERLMDKLFFNEYTFTNSIFPGRDWGSGSDRPLIEFDPDLAEELLAEAGYEKRDEEGYLVNAQGERFEITLEYGTQGWERIWLVVKEDYEAAGVKFNLKLIDPSTLMKKVSERQFKVHWQGWGALLFPNPETSWRSMLADQDYNNNIPGFKNARVDELCKQYNLVKTWDERKAITKEIDTLVAAEFPYAYGWHSSYFRLLYWNRYGHPEKYFTRTGDVAAEMMIALWWFDEAKEKALQAALDADAPLPQAEMIVKPWAKDGN